VIDGETAAAPHIHTNGAGVVETSTEGDLGKSVADSVVMRGVVGGDHHVDLPDDAAAPW
jgi:hypothetical protein